MFKRRKPDEQFAPGQHSAGEHPSGMQPGRSAPDAVAQAIAMGGRADPSGFARQFDPGVGVPPFRPAQPKEASPMGRTPISAVSTAPTPTVPALDGPEARTLVVGRGISLQGTVQDAERLVVEGTVEATMIHATELAIAHGGVFKGEIEVEDAEVAGTIDGTLTVRANLIVRATGRVLGTARCRRLQVEDGGQITGRIDMITEGGKPAEPAKPAAQARQPVQPAPVQATPVLAAPVVAAPVQATPVLATPIQARAHETA